MKNNNEDGDNEEPKDSYTVQNNIGRGAYGSIYKVKREDGKIFAMKVSPRARRNSLRTEMNLMSQLQGSPYFPKLIGYNTGDSKDYLVMECLGPALENFLEISPIRGFTMSTALRVGIEMLRAIRAFHSKGIIHRDIKPSNFLVRPSRKYPITLIDYGISKRIIDEETGQLLPKSTGFIGFVGTLKYASVNAHEGLEQSFKDDIYSWFVSLLEIMVGKVPWHTQKNQKEMIYQKKYCDMETFCSELPKQIILIYHLILNMKADEVPNYDLIIAFLVEAMEENGCNWDDKFDWESYSERRLRKLKNYEPIPKDGDGPNIPKNLPSTKVDIPFKKLTPPAIPKRPPIPSPKNAKTEKESNSSSSSAESLSSSITPEGSYDYTESLSSYSSSESYENSTLHVQVSPAKSEPIKADKSRSLTVEPAKNNVKKKKLFHFKRRKHRQHNHNTLSIEQQLEEAVVNKSDVPYSEPRLNIEDLPHIPEGSLIANGEVKINNEADNSILADEEAENPKEVKEEDNSLLVKEEIDAAKEEEIDTVKEEEIDAAKEEEIDTVKEEVDAVKEEEVDEIKEENNTVKEEENISAAKEEEIDEVEAEKEVKEETENPNTVKEDDSNVSKKEVETPGVVKEEPKVAVEAKKEEKVKSCNKKDKEKEYEDEDVGCQCRI